MARAEAKRLPADLAAIPTVQTIGTEAAPVTLRAGAAWFAGLVGPVVAAICIAVEPAPADADASEPLIGTILGVLLLVGYVGAAVNALGRRPVALRWATGVGLLSLAMTAACPTSGHHAGIGLWWAVQFATCAAATAVAVALGGRRRLGR